MNLVNFTCPPNLASHMVQVFEGEYDVALEFDTAPMFLDIGACVGAAARWARIRWPGCTIACYEPNPKAHRILEKNLTALVDRFSVSKTAVLGTKSIHDGSARPSTIRLYQGRHNLGEASVYLETGAVESDYVDVPVTFARDLPACDFLKADCEGPEREILHEYLDTHEPPAAVAVEYHSAAESKRMQTELAVRGYRLIKAAEYELNRGVLVWRHEPEID